MDRPGGRRVLKFDGAFGPEGCGIALLGDEYKVSVTCFAFLSYRKKTFWTSDSLTAISQRTADSG